MKKILFVLSFVGLLLPAVAGAAQFNAGSAASLEQSQVVNDDLYLFGGTVIDSGTVHGDFSGAGGTVLVSGAVDGDLQVAGGTVSVVSTVGQSLRAAGGTVIINSTVAKDVVAAGGTVTIEGKIGRDVVASGDTVTLNAPVSGNVQINAQKVILGSNALISGNFTYRSSTQVEMQPGAKVVGKVTYTPTAAPNQSQTVGGAVAAFFTFWLIAKFLTYLALSLLLVWLLNRYVVQIVTDALVRPVYNFVAGLVLLIVIPIVSIVLCVTILGLPLGILGILGYVVFIIWSSLMVPLMVGSLVYKLTTKATHYEASWKTALVGVVVYSVVTLMPFVGWLLPFVFFPLAFGAVATMKWRIAKDFI